MHGYYDVIVLFLILLFYIVVYVLCSDYMLLFYLMLCTAIMRKSTCIDNSQLQIDVPDHIRYKMQPVAISC